MLKSGNDLYLPASTHMSMQWRVGAQYDNMRKYGILTGGTLCKVFRSNGGMMLRLKPQPCLVSQLQIPLLCHMLVYAIAPNRSMT